MIAARHLAKDNAARILILTPKAELVRQIADDLRGILRLSAGGIVELFGRISPERRATEYVQSGEKGVRIMVATPETVRNDISEGRLSLEGLSLLVLDESHHARGDYAYVDLARQARRLGVPILGASASPAKTPAELAELRELLGVDYHYRVSMPQGLKLEQVHIVDLDPCTRQAADWLEDLAFKFASQLDSFLQRYPYLQEQLRKMTELHRAVFKFPTQKGCEEFERARAKSNLDFITIQSWLSLRHLAYLHALLTTYGKFSFLNFAGQRLWGLRFTAPVLKTDRRPGVPNEHAFFRKKIYEDDLLLRAFRLLAEGSETLYSNLLAAGSEPEVMSKSFGNAWPALLSGVGRARQNARAFFFEEARKALAERNYLDHPKEGVLVDLCSRYLWKWPRAAGLVFVDDALYGRFLVERLSSARMDLSFKCAMIAGSKHMPARELKEIIEGFKRHEIKLLIMTSVGEEGLHFGTGDYGIALSQTPEPKRLAQRLGRVRHGGSFEGEVEGKAGRMPAMMHYLLTAGSQDVAFFRAGLMNRRRMEKFGYEGKATFPRRA